MESTIGFRGDLRTKVMRAKGPGLLWKLSNFPNVWPGLWREWLAKRLKMAHLGGRLYVRLIQADGTSRFR